MKGKTILVVVLALTVVLAGCTGGNGPAADGNDDSNGGDGGPNEGNGDGDSSAGDGDTWRLFEFDRTGKYTFDVFMEDEGSGTLVWDVQRVSGDEVTIGIDYDVGDSSYESTVTGTRDVARQQLLTTPAGTLLVTTIFTPGLWYGGRELAVGNGWSYQTGEGSGSFEVTERRTVADLTCFATEMKIDGELRHEGCFSPDHGLAPYSAWYDEDGEPVMEMELVEYGPTDGPNADGDDGADDADGADDVDRSDDVDDEMGDDETDDGPVDDAVARWNALEFETPATYTYDVFLEDEGSGTLVWDVQRVSGDQVTVRIDYDVGDSSYESTVTGTPETVRQQTMMTPAGVLLMLTMYTPMSWYADQELRVGNEWSIATDDGTMQFGVTGTDTYAGVQCYATEVTIDGTTQHESCIAPDLGLAPYSAWYDENGALQVKIELVNFEEN